MTISTYLDLQTEFQGILNRRDITTTRIKSYIQAGFSRAMSELRVPDMEINTSYTIPSNGYVGVPIPASMTELKQLWNNAVTADGTFMIEERDLETVLEWSQLTDHAKFYVRRGSVWLLGPTPLVGDVINIDYLDNPFTPLVADGDTNWLSVNKPYAIVYAALSYAGDYFTDVRQEAWENRYTQERDNVQQRADREALMGNPVMKQALDMSSDFNDGL